MKISKSYFFSDMNTCCMDVYHLQGLRRKPYLRTDRQPGMLLILRWDGSNRKMLTERGTRSGKRGAPAMSVSDISRNHWSIMRQTASRPNSGSVLCIWTLRIWIWWSKEKRGIKLALSPGQSVRPLRTLMFASFITFVSIVNFMPRKDKFKTSSLDQWHLYKNICQICSNNWWHSWENNIQVLLTGLLTWSSGS